METIQRNRMLWRIPLVVAILFALFWGIWYLVAGEIPNTTQIRWTEKTNIQLPFAMSRVWDIIFAPLWAMILILLFTNNRIRKDENLVFGLGAGLVFGLAFGLGVGLFAGLGAGLSAGLGVGLFAGLVFGLGAGLGVGLFAGLKLLFSQKFWTRIIFWVSGK